MDRIFNEVWQSSGKAVEKIFQPLFVLCERKDDFYHIGRKLTLLFVDMANSTLCMCDLSCPLYKIIVERRKNMDQIQIGKLIAETRKAQNLTQRQLADTLSILDKTGWCKHHVTR